MYLSKHTRVEKSSLNFKLRVFGNDFALTLFLFEIFYSKRMIVYFKDVSKNEFCIIAFDISFENKNKMGKEFWQKTYLMMRTKYYTI